MDNTNLQSPQPLGSNTGGLPPLPSSPTASAPAPSSNEWPVKKKSNKWKTIVGGIAAILLVLGAAGGAFYFTQNLNQASVPTAPESEPQAAYVQPTRVAKSDACPQGCGVGEVCVAGRGCRKAGGNADPDADSGGIFQGGCNAQNCPAPAYACAANGACLATGKAEIPSTGGYQNPAACPAYVEGGSNPNWVTNSDGTRTCVNASATPSPGGGATSCGSGYYACQTTSGARCCAIGKTQTVEKDGGGGGSTQAVCEAKTPTLAATSMARTATNSAELTWANTATTGSVKLWVSKSSSPASCTGGTADCIVNGITLPLSTTTRRVTGLQPSTTYYWAVMSFVSDSCQALSGISNFTTAALACVNSTWTPNQNTVCTGNSFIQTSNCDATRSATGTKTDGACATCTDTTWTPNQNTVCVGDDLTQTSNCGATRTVDGTKTDGVCAEEEGEPELSIEKRAFEDEEDNAAGEYSLDDEIDTVSKEQVFVYAFDIYNAGDGKAENVEVTDTLKGNNQELLTYVDGDSRCTYTSSTRKVVCSGMDLDSEEDGVYAFRVKVSSSATNGETIRNVGILTYDDMPTDGEDEASLELNISTVVSCNHSCTSDSECSSGLTCDPDINKCRKAACLESSNCICPLPSREPTEAPTKKPTATQKAQPTALPEAGILDFPGVAAFGGGLLLAIIGILLAL